MNENSSINQRLQRRASHNIPISEPHSAAGFKKEFKTSEQGTYKKY